MDTSVKAPSVNPDSPLFVGKMTLHQFGRDLGKAPRTVRRLLAELGIPTERIGNLKFIDVEQARARIAEHATGGLAPPRKRGRKPKAETTAPSAA